MKVRHLQNATSKLVAAAQGQNPRAQRLLFERYAPQMLGLCRSYLKQIALAEDALSQGFYKAFKHIGQLKKAALFESWLRRIMVNESLSLLRKNSGITLEYELEGQLEFSVPADAPNHLAYADLQKLIEQLQDNRYKLFGSRFFELGWAWVKPLKREKAKLHLKYGVSLMVNGYKLTDSQYLTKQNEGITFQSFDSPLTKSKLTITQLVFPVHLHFGRIERTAERVGTGWPVELKIYRRKPFQSMRFGLGGYAGFNVRNVHKLKYRDEDGRRKKLNTRTT